MSDQADLLRAAMDAQNLTDNDTRAGIAAIAIGESNMQDYAELGYGHTSNERIREVFGDRVPADDAELDTLKADDHAFFDRVYGPTTETGRELGNVFPDDGFNFRGRGLIQLTGRGNYQRYSTKIGHPEIMQNPDLANDPALSAALTVAYIVDRYKGGGFDALMRCVGNNAPDIQATKERYYQEYLASGEFNWKASP